MDTATKAIPTLQQSVEVFLMNVMSLVVSASEENRGKMSARSVKCETAFVAPICRNFSRFSAGKRGTVTGKIGQEAGLEEGVRPSKLRSRVREEVT